MYARHAYCYHDQYKQEFEDNAILWSEIMCKFNEFRWTFWKTRKVCFEDLKSVMELNQYADTDRLRNVLNTHLSQGILNDGLAVVDCELNQESEFYADEIDYYALDRSAPPPTRRHPGFNSITGWYDPNRLGLADCGALMERKRKLFADGKLPEFLFIYEMAELAKLRRKAIMLGWE